MRPVEVTEGSGPLILAMPHTGTYVPPGIGKLLNAEGRKLADTDWHIESLYNGLRDDATVIRATFHRYVIDANRDPGGESLYPGQNTTGLVPDTDFDGRPIWDREISAPEVAERLAAYHEPYHSALRAQVDRVRASYGVAILYDCHSIRSHIPFLFEGLLPDFNIGTNSFTSCATGLERAVAAVCAGAEGYTSVLNGRFRGGWTTRQHGRPGDGVHAIQMELAQSTYLMAEAPPWRIDPAKTARLRGHLSEVLNAIIALAPTLKVT
jgi:N-formylglutamate deformylase